MIGPALFSRRYAAARERFRQAARERGLAVESHVLDLPGVDGEELALDVVFDGDPQAPGLLMTTSACHGVEGYAGSAIQAGLLRHGALARPGVAVLHLHALNPHGFSHGRRVTQENVDLNRNLVDFQAPLPVNEGYARLHPLLLPPQWPPSAEVAARLAAEREALGPRGWQAAVSQGQFDHSDGMYFGGREPTWSHRALRRVLERHVAGRGHLAWIDLHTGLGPFGVGERIFASIDEGPALDRARAWWGPGVTSVFKGDSNSIPLHGPIQFALPGSCPGLEHTNVCLEFGTVPLPEMFEAVRADHWLHRHPEADAALAAGIRARMRAAFDPDDDGWREQVWRQGLEVAQQAARGVQNLV